MTLDCARLERPEIAATVSLYRAAPRDLALRAGLGVAPIGGSVAFLLRAADTGMLNRIVGLGLDLPTTEEELDRALALFDQAGLANAYVQVCPDAEPSELPRWLEARGLAPYRRSWAKFVHEGEAPEVATDLRLALARPDQAHDFGRVTTAAFGLPPMLTSWVEQILGRDDWRVFLAFDGEQAVAAGALHLSEHGAWLGFGSTLASHRGRHAQRALLARRVAEARALGAKTIVTETGEAVVGEPQVSYANIERAGFRFAYSRKNYTRAAARPAKP